MVLWTEEGRDPRKSMRKVEKGLFCYDATLFDGDDPDSDDDDDEPGDSSAAAPASGPRSRASNRRCGEQRAAERKRPPA